MNSQEIMNLVRQLLTLLSGFAVGAGWLTHDQASTAIGDIFVIVPAAVSLGSVCWSVYAHWNMKKVPEGARVLTPEQQLAQRPVIKPASFKVIAGFMLLCGLAFAASAAHAATSKEALATFNADLLAKIQADAQAASADAKANNDVIAQTCYDAIAADAQTKLNTSTATGAGALTLFQKVRDISRLNASPVGTQLIVGCAPLVQDAKLNFLQFFTNIGAAVLLKGVIPLP